MKIKLNNDMELILDNENSDGICHVSLIDSSDGAVINTCDIDEGKLFEFISSEWNYNSQKESLKSTNERNTLDGIDHNLNDSDLEPYLVHVTELYSRNVVIYAEDHYMAEQLANDLCEDGILLIDFDDFNDRNIETIRKAKETDLAIYQAFGPDKLSESLNIPLKDRIQNAKENTINQSEKNAKNNELIL